MLIFFAIRTFGWLDTWHLLQVPALEPSFADLRIVQGTIASISQGYDPQIINPGDPWHRAMNYPYFWVNIAYFFSLSNENNYLLFVSVIVMLYLVSCGSLIYKYPSCWIFFTLISGSSLLAVERGNNDLFVFFLLYISTIVPILFSAVIVILASTLKIYPIFSIFSLYQNRIILLITAIFLCIYFIYKLDEIQRIISITPVIANISYGSKNLAQAIRQFFNVNINPICISILISTLSIALLKFKNIRIFIAKYRIPNDKIRLFFTGSGIFLGTFLFSSNFDYKLIFLSFTIPYINSMKNKKISVFLLSNILISSNNLILGAFLGLAGVAICIFSKCLLFILILWLFIIELLNQLRSYYNISKCL